MANDFNDFLDKNIPDVMQSIKCSPKHSLFVKEVLTDEFEKFKEKLLKIKAHAFLDKAITNNNVDLFNELIKSWSLLDFQFEEIIIAGRASMFDSFVIKQPQKSNKLIQENYVYYLKLAIDSNCLPIQQHIVDNFIKNACPQKIINIKETVHRKIQDTNDLKIVKNILTSPALKDLINVNDIFVDSKSFFCQVVSRQEKEIFDFLMSDELIHPVDLTKDNYQAFFYSVINEFEHVESLGDSHYFNHLIYDKQIEVTPEFIERFNDFLPLKQKVIQCIEKRDFFFKIDKEFDVEDNQQPRIKL